MSLNQIKRKISSIKSTEKITNAMCLIATTKLKKQRELFENVKDYFYDFYKVVNILLDDKENKILDFEEIKNPVDATLWININSDMGLCGSYNASLDSYVLKKIQPQDFILQFGKQGLEFLKWNNIHTNLIDFYNFGEKKVPYNVTLNIANKILELFKQGKFNKIKINYVKFINALNHEPVTISVLPFDKKLFSYLNNNESKTTLNSEYEFNPNKEEILMKLLPDYVATLLYGALIEAKVSELSARRNAMDLATKNAKELGSKYLLQYNNHRQAQITTEIIEIISGSVQKNKEERILANDE